MFDQKTRRAISDIAGSAELEPALLAALIEVESAGRIFAEVDGRREPLIRFEGHYFYRRLTHDKRVEALKAGLASPNAGGVRNPRSQAARWALLERAAKLDTEAAYESSSWGVGQVMGANWRALGFENVFDFVSEARSGLRGQLRLVLAFLETHDLLEPLRNRDWQRFARGYNGPAYARNGYHLKLALAYRRQRRIQEANEGSVGLSRAEVLRLQRRLNEAGAHLQPDGLFGPAARRALIAFQSDAGLPASGRLDEATRAALTRRPEALPASIFPLARLIHNMGRVLRRVTRHQRALRAQ
jgi:hypothetical protein